ncbi:HWE histidine kinase domain-containing protein [Microvirga pudoricolor]|uniref:HWE histidine kinase domain-containing protein n=1 Tax=Microvirga pudoricolor TaxID=2778729 RepID=UPI001950A762|nr:HWE histidine kinase domain-containing protein [Microvirga pudoricolor]MBM6596561.1 GAF domain-containing protein [Microvirga pudoricolor]
MIPSTDPASLVPSVDLTNCDREPIHIPGAIQPHGCLLVCTLPDWTIAHASLNAPDILKRPLEEILNVTLEGVLPAKTVHDLRNTLQSAMISDSAERLADADVGTGLDRQDIAVHLSGSRAVIEIIPQSGADVVTADPTMLVKSLIGRLRRATNIDRFLQMAAQQMRAVTGYDRVLIYKFLHDSSGQVVAEAIRSGLPPFLGLRYPASDIPAQARELYKRQWLRLIPDAEYRPVPLEPSLDDKGLPVDLGLASLRSVSPIHIEYMRNMGVRASLTVSLMRGKELWGLIACHHDAPRRLSAATCAATELFGQVFSLQIEAKEQEVELARANRLRECQDRFLASMGPSDTVFDSVEPYRDLLNDLIACDGVGSWSGGRFSGVGVTPPEAEIPKLVAFLDGKSPTEPFATAELGRVLPSATLYADRVSGLLAIPFARTPRDYLFFFRREVEQTITWGGNPHKAVENLPGRDRRISPRKSFEAWREKVRGQSLPWLDWELRVAETLRVSLLEVILRRADLVERERRTAQESQSLLIEELNHRVKNILALISSLVRQSRQGVETIEDFTRDIDSRIRALASAHDQLTRTGWNAATLRGLLDMESRAWTKNGTSGPDLNGPPALLDSRAYQAIALVFHEMMTNAAKYGALSTPGGHLIVEWNFRPNGDLSIDWRETDGPPVAPPQRRGFGTIVTEQTIPFELQGKTSITFDPAGLRASFLIPAAHVTPGSEEDEVLPKDVARVTLSDKRLLLVEDSMMIALDAQALLQGVGAEVEIAGTVADACRALRLGSFDAAVLDINLSGETSFPVADDLKDRKRPFIFATGYGESTKIPERFRQVPVVTKPYDEKALRAAFARYPDVDLVIAAQ